MARARFGILKDDDLSPKVFQAIDSAVFFRKDEASVFGLASLPTSQEQLPGPMYEIDDVRGIGTVHVKIDLALFKKFGELGESRSYNDSSFDRRCRGKFSRHVMDKVAKVLFDLLLMRFSDNPQRNRFGFQLLPRLCRGVRGDDYAQEKNCKNDPRFSAHNCFRKC